jgi:hypothetical protein
MSQPDSHQKLIPAIASLLSLRGAQADQQKRRYPVLEKRTISLHSLPRNSLILYYNEHGISTYRWYSSD